MRLLVRFNPLLASIWVLLVLRGPHILLELRVNGTMCRVVSSRLREAEKAIGNTPHLVRLLLVLPIIFPEAHAANLLERPVA